jgi:DNA-binding beta-propeller fold protein YncE
VVVLKHLVVAVFLLIFTAVFSLSLSIEKVWGSVGSKNGQFSEPQGITVDSKGMVYVADTLNHRVQVFDTNGKHKASFGRFGEKSGEFRFPHDIVVDSKGNVYVADSQNGRIQKFNDKYKFLKAWGSKGPGDGQFDGAMFMTIDSSDRIYVGDAFNQRIQIFDTEGNLLETIGGKVTMLIAMEDGNFATISGLAVDSSGNLYVSDDLNRRIQKFDRQGNFVEKWTKGASGNFELPGQIAIDSYGNVFFLEKRQNKVYALDSSGKYLCDWGSEGTADGQFKTPFGIALGNNESLYIVELSGNRVQKFKIKY